MGFQAFSSGPGSRLNAGFRPFAPGVPPGPPALVQDTSSGGSSAAAFSALTGTGHLLAVCSRVYQPSGGTWPSAVTDNGGNTWAYPAAQQNGPPPGSVLATAGPVWIGYALGTAPMTTITVTEPGTYQEIISLSEFSGFTTVTAGAQNTGTNPTLSVPYSDGSLIITACYSLSTSIGLPTGFTAFPNSATDNVSACYQFMSGSGTEVITWPTTGAACVAVVFS